MPARNPQQLRPLDYEVPLLEEFAAATVSDEIAAPIWKFAHAQLGKPYDYSALLGVLAHRDWHADDRWYCSELIAAAFESVGLPLLRSEFADRVTPATLYLSPLLRRVDDPSMRVQPACSCRSQKQPAIFAA